MKKSRFNQWGLVFGLTVVFCAFNVHNALSQKLCTQAGGSDQITGVKDGYRYELWNQNAQGTACMTLGSGALFSGEWTGILNYLARRGLGYNQTQEHQEIGRFFATYDCDYNPSSSSGNSYLSIYGWTVNPLIEYYIVEDWRNWIPSMAAGVSPKGSFTIDGSIYDIYESTRVNQPSIVGTATFKQYFSIRRDERNSGTINISEHFDKWESLGMDLGRLHEVSFVVEGYQSSGNFAFNALDVFVGEEDPVLGTEEKVLPVPFAVYPNPNSGSVSVHFKEPVSKASIKIYDASGKVVFSKKNIKEDRIQISDLKSGLHIVVVNNNKLTHKTKLLVD